MTAVPAAAATQAAKARAEAVLLYRDDGPLARALGHVLGRTLPLPASILLLAGVLPLVAVLAVEGDDARGLLGLALAWLVVCGGLSSGRPHSGRFAWVPPPLLRLTEYGSLIALAALYGDDAVPACFAFLGALAFRHYDAVYRLRHQGSGPSELVRDLGGGWEGRLLLAYVLLVADVLTEGLYVAAGLVAVVSVAESVAAWLRFSRAQRPAMYADEEDEDE